MGGDEAVQWQQLAFAVVLSIALLMKAVQSRIPETTLQNLVNQTCSNDMLPTTQIWHTEDTPLQQLIEDLTSAASSQISSNSSVESGGETFYGAYQCRGDLNSIECYHCVSAATLSVRSTPCSDAVDARVDLEACSFFYQNTSIAPDFTLDYYVANGITTDSDVFIADRSLVLGKVIDAAPSAAYYYAASDDGVVYAMAQCFGFLTRKTCAACLSKANQSMETLVSNPENQIGTRLMLGSCLIRYENYSFLNPTPFPAPSPSMLAAPTPTAGSGSTESDVPFRKTKSRVGILAAVFAVVVVLAFTIFFACWMKGKCGEEAVTHIAWQERPNDMEIMLLEKMADTHYIPHEVEVKLLEELADTRYIPPDQLRKATENFHPSRVLGRGGFGSVYKGTLPGPEEGQAIAIKKISALCENKDSSFLTEVKTITRVRHPNLIKLIGFSFDLFDKYLIYEFMPQKSLDKHIFGAEAERALTWNTRRKIILGTARGLQHLHCSSLGRRIIHRDIKAANILLDEELEPKIGDFGLAKLLDFSQTHAVTEKGFLTRGYAPPEYLNDGRITEKFDIYSFGVVFLEILSGRKVYEPALPPLLVWARQQYEKGMPLDLMDPRLPGEYDAEEARRFIKLALQCAQDDEKLRPDMLKVVTYLENPEEMIDAPPEAASSKPKDIRE